MIEEVEADLEDTAGVGVAIKEEAAVTEEDTVEDEEVEAAVIAEAIGINAGKRRAGDTRIDVMQPKILHYLLLHGLQR